MPTNAICGRILDENGNPLRGARVHIGGYGGYRETRTDRNGRFLFDGLEPNLRFDLTVSSSSGMYKEWAGIHQQTDTPTGSDLVIRLLRSGQLRFRILDKDTEKPVSNGAAYFWSPMSATGFNCDPEGWGVGAFGGGKWAGRLKVRGYVPVVVSFDIPPGGVAEKTFLVERGLSVQGRIVNEDDAPAAGAQVFFGHHADVATYDSTVTASDGRFALTGFAPGAPYTFQVSAPGRRTVTRTGLRLPLEQPLTAVLVPEEARSLGTRGFSSEKLKSLPEEQKAALRVARVFVSAVSDQNMRAIMRHAGFPFLLDRRMILETPEDLREALERQFQGRDKARIRLTGEEIYPIRGELAVALSPFSRMFVEKYLERSDCLYLGHVENERIAVFLRSGPSGWKVVGIED